MGQHKIDAASPRHETHRARHATRSGLPTLTGGGAEVALEALVDPERTPGERHGSGARAVLLLLMAAGFATVAAALGTTLLAPSEPQASDFVPSSHLAAAGGLSLSEARAAFEAEARRVRRAEAPLATLAMGNHAVH